MGYAVRARTPQADWCGKSLQARIIVFSSRAWSGAGRHSRVDLSWSSAGAGLAPPLPGPNRLHAACGRSPVPPLEPLQVAPVLLARLPLVGAESLVGELQLLCMPFAECLSLGLLFVELLGLARGTTALGEAPDDEAPLIGAEPEADPVADAD